MSEAEPHPPRSESGSSVLNRVHPILIGFAIALGSGFVLYSVHRYVTRQERQALIVGIVSAVATSALALYLRWFLGKRPH